MFDRVINTFRQKGRDKDPNHPHYEPDTYLEQPRTGLLRQQRITYEIDGGVLKRRTVTRIYMKGEGRYQDSHVTEVLGDASMFDLNEVELGNFAS